MQRTVELKRQDPNEGHRSNVVVRISTIAFVEYQHLTELDDANGYIHFVGGHRIEVDVDEAERVARIVSGEALMAERGT